MTASRAPKWLPTLLLPILCSCSAEGEHFLTVSHDENTACAESSAALADGLQTGEELIITFECVNTSGNFDPVLDALYAMDTATDPDGTPLLDLWVSAINEELTNAEGGPVTIALTPSQIGDAVSQLLGFVESGAPQVALDLTAEAIDAHVVEAFLGFAAVLNENLESMGRGGEPVSLSSWLDALQSILCQDDPATVSECRSTLEVALAGMAANKTATEYDPNDPGNDDLRQTLYWLLYAGGDERAATEAAQGLARGLSYLSQDAQFLDKPTEPPPLETLLTTLLPALFGDDTSTRYVYEGYPSHNASDSALYGIMTTLRSQKIQDALANSLDETRALAYNYYEGKADFSNPGYATPYRTEECANPIEAPDTHGVANNGVDQLLRLLSATNKSYTSSDTCTMLFAPLLILGSPYLDVSGSTSVASLILEFAAVLPLELLKIGSTILNTQGITDLVNGACGLNMQYDDTEVLEVAVYFPLTPQYSLPLIAAINDAHRIDDVVNYLDAVWQTRATCEMGPTLRLAFNPEKPPAQGEGGDLDDILPNPGAPAGSTYHDQVVQPMLEVLMDVAPVAPELLYPVGRSLQTGQDELVQLLLRTGEMAGNPESNLTKLPLLQAELSQLSGGGGAPDLGPAARALDRSDIALLLATTLSAPEVLTAVTVGTDPAETSLTEALSAQIKAGTFSTFLQILEELLRDLDESQSSATPTP